MTLQAPFVAAPLRPHIPVELAALTARARNGRLTEADKKTGALLLADTLCDLLDFCFTDLMKELQREHPSRSIEMGLATSENIKEKIHHYLGWIVTFLSSERLVPVIEHYNSLVHEMTLHGQPQTVVAFPISAALAAEASRVLGELRSGEAKNADEGMTLLIHAIEILLEPAILIPKDLMKFNFLVNKTLDGVISVVMALFKRELRKLGPQLPRTHYPQVAQHLERFLIVSLP
ncbi:MAG: hypothetical protein ACRERR_00605 [Moraxellaceae bacterium]